MSTGNPNPPLLKEQTKEDIPSGTGVLGVIRKDKELNTYYNAKRYIIIGPSGSGKSTLAANLAIDMIPNYNNLLVISPTTEDASMLKLIQLCDEAGMNTLFTSIDEEGNLNIPEEISKCLVIVDDYYSQRNMPLCLKKFLSEMFIRCRHNKNNIIYIAHSDRNIPHEIKNGCNGLFITEPIDNITGSESLVPEGNPEHMFWMLNRYIDPDKSHKCVFKDYDNEGQIISKLRNKIHPEDRKKRKNGVLPGPGLMARDPWIEVLNGERVAGNSAAKKSIKQTIDLNKAVRNIYLNDL